MKVFIFSLVFTLNFLTIAQAQADESDANESNNYVYIPPEFAFKEGRIYNDGSFGDFLSLVLPPEVIKLVLRISDERAVLMKNNLEDTGVKRNNGEINCEEVMNPPHRTAQGVCYFHGIGINVDVGYGEGQNTTYVGSVGARFGRNIKPPTEEELEVMERDLLDPNPRLISKELFTRKNGMIPATTINLLAAAWLQAQNHDWFSHGKNVAKRPSQGSSGQAPLSEEQKKMFDPILIPPVAGDDLFPNGMMIPRTRPDFTQTEKQNYPRSFRNTVTHWWDASEIYGSDEQTILRMRTNPLTGELLPKGQIAVDEENRRLYYDEYNRPITGFSDNWWVGLELFHSLFAMEHNYVARKLAEKYPRMTDEDIFQTARLVISALIAKIHTIEWTPALLDNPSLHIGMRANWEGLASPLVIFNDMLLEWLVRSSDKWGQALYGVTGPGSLYLYDVPFTLTEEFVAVYRMHPLIPDDFIIHNPQGQRAGTLPANDTRDIGAKELSYQSSSSTLSLMYSLGVENPGALTLHNFPVFMQKITVPNNTEGMPEVVFDLAALDVLRDRERLVPRYNEFRRRLHLKPLETFADLTDDEETVALLEEIYGGDVEKLDLLVGSLAENDRYEGFAFGNTPFYIFALMASRRLMTDPFFSDYFKPRYYTRWGYDWVLNQTMIDVIVRHYPELKDSFRGVVNAFHPWRPTPYDYGKQGKVPIPYTPEEEVLLDIPEDR